MTHLKIELNTTGIEEVSGAVIAKLYDLVHSGTLDNTSNLLGRLHTTSTYLNYIDYLQGQFEGSLFINADNVYVNLLDSIFESKIAQLFGNGTGITLQLILSVTNISYGDFNGTNCVMANLTPFVNFTTMSSNMFANCSNLLYINTGSILKMGPHDVNGEDFDTYMYQLFGGCTSLKKIVCPNLQYVGSGSFYNNDSIEEIYLPSVIKMGGIVFRNTNSLSFVYIGSNVTYIGLFFSIPAITNRCKVVIMATTPPSTMQGLDNGDNFHGLVDIYVPSSSLNTYKTNSEWSLLASHIYAIETDLPQLYKEKVNTELGLTIFTLS